MTALFRAYLDESEDSASGIYAVGGFVGKAKVWESIEAHLPSLPRGVSCFHATDCFTGNREFDGVDIPERVSLLDALTDLIVGHEVWLIGYGLDSRVYKRLAPKGKDNEFLGNKYAAPFGGIVAVTCEGMGNTPDPDRLWEILRKGEDWEQCDFFIEKNEYAASANRVINSVRNCCDLWFRDRIGTDTYGTKSGHGGIPLLQVADLGAFLVTKHIANAPDGRIPYR